jgi:ATP-dependent DNA helicase RecQ
VGAVTVLANGDVEPTGRISRRRELLRAVREAVGEQEDFQQFQRSRIAMMQGYAETFACRRAYLLNYFGEEFSGPCETCDNDLVDDAEADGEAGPDVRAHADEHPSGPFPLSSRVAHERWGAGSVMRYEDDTIYVLFDSVGYKTLALELVTAQGLLRPIGADEQCE